MIKNYICDGSCINNGKQLNKRAAIAWGILNDNLEIIESYCKQLNNITNITNNIAELLAILEVLKLIHNDYNNNNTYIIYSDSMYSINSITVWYGNWERNNWKTSNGKSVKNMEIIQKIYLYMRSNIKFSHVRGHQNNDLTIHKSHNIIDNMARSSIS
jgi:ribonuclease HI